MSSTEFIRVTFQNLLSFGNDPVTIELNKSPATIITGKNGRGKSTMLDALCYGLFGKPFRDINLPLLVNSRVGRELLVEVEFRKGPHHYLVRRGMAPKVFEIYEDGTLLDQDGKASDYQAHLENTILKMNEKSFRQIIVIGAKYKPFMQLNAAERRGVVEELLDLTIFSTMNKVLKLKMDGLKERLRVIDQDVTLLEDRVQIQETHVRQAAQDTASKRAALQTQIEQNWDVATRYTQEAVDLDAVIAKLNAEVVGEGAARATERSLEGMANTLMGRVLQHTKDRDFFRDNNTCPTCAQGIEHGHKQSMVAEKDAAIAKLQDGLTHMEAKLVPVREKLRAIEAAKALVLEKQVRLAEVKASLASALTYNEKLQDDIDALEDAVAQTGNGHTRKLETLRGELEAKRAERTTALSDRTHWEIVGLLLKDNGIKAGIIKRYLPEINATMNHYLQALGLPVQFVLNESFEERILSANRQNFTYYSFSEGQKQRIDLAILLTWRHIATKKNSVSSNLLIFDESFDSSLDSDGLEDLSAAMLAVVNEGKTNVFVISHTAGDRLQDKFSDRLHFEFFGGYSRTAP